MGVWIEISCVKTTDYNGNTVTPFVGVWIEILLLLVSAKRVTVTPFVGVWIEIHWELIEKQIVPGHSLRGSVD